MAENREKSQQYKKIWNALANWLKNSTGWKVGGVAKEGSRRSGTFTSKSDLDVDFWISETYDKQRVYDDIIPKLRKSFPNSHVQKGGSENVLKFSFKGNKTDIVLLPKKEFMEKVEKYKKDVI
jgi:hypothetical protein